MTPQQRPAEHWWLLRNMETRVCEGILIAGACLQRHTRKGQAADAVPERLPAFPQQRGPVVPEHSFEVNTVW